MRRFLPRPRAPWRKVNVGRLPTELPVRDGLHVDWHCHSRWSDGGGTVPELLEQASKVGVTLGISDHGLTDNARLRSPEQLATYLADLEQWPVLRGLEISIGEVGPTPAREMDDERRMDAGQLPPTDDVRAVFPTMTHDGVMNRFDYVIASLHAVSVPEGLVHSSRFLNWRAGLYPAYRPALRRYARRGYFETLLTALEETAARWPVRILGHFCLLPELANKEGVYRAQDEPEPDSEAAEWLDAVIRVCVRHGIAIEMNSKSRAPHAGFIKRALELGARFSLGSDAHQRHRAGDLSYGRLLVERLEIPPDRVMGVVDVLREKAA